MKGQCVIYFGLIPTTDLVGAFLLVVQATALVRTFQNNSIMQTVWLELRAPISLLCKVTTGLMIVMLSQFSVLLTTATDAATKQPSCRWMSLWSLTCKFLVICKKFILACSSILSLVRTSFQMYPCAHLIISSDLNLLKIKSQSFINYTKIFKHS